MLAIFEGVATPRVEDRWGSRYAGKISGEGGKDGFSRRTEVQPLRQGPAICVYDTQVPVVREQEPGARQHHGQIGLAQVVDRWRGQRTDVAAFAQGHVAPAQVLVHGSRPIHTQTPHTRYTTRFRGPASVVRLAAKSEIDDTRLFQPSKNCVRERVKRTLLYGSTIIGARDLICEN